MCMGDDKYDKYDKTCNKIEITNPCVTHNILYNNYTLSGSNIYDPNSDISALAH